MADIEKTLLEIHGAVGRLEGRTDGLHDSLRIVVAQLEAIRVETRDQGSAIGALRAGCSSRHLACDARFGALASRQKRVSEAVAGVREDTDVLRIEDVRRRTRSEALRDSLTAIWRYGRPFLLALIAGTPLAAAIYAALK